MRTNGIETRLTHDQLRTLSERIDSKYLWVRVNGRTELTREVMVWRRVTVELAKRAAALTAALNGDRS